MFEREKLFYQSALVSFNRVFIAFMTQLHKNDLCFYLPRLILVQASHSPIHNSNRCCDTLKLHCVIPMLLFQLSLHTAWDWFWKCMHFFSSWFLSKALFIEMEGWGFCFSESSLQYFMSLCRDTAWVSVAIIFQGSAACHSSWTLMKYYSKIAIISCNVERKLLQVKWQRDMMTVFPH